MQRLLPIFCLLFAQLSAQPIPDFNTPPSVVWTFTSRQPFFGSPVIDGSTVFVGGLDSTFYALDLATGKPQWKMKTRGAIRSQAVVNGPVLYLNGGDGNLYCLDKKTGALRWTFTTNGEKKYDFADYHHSTPVLKEGVLYMGSGDGNFYAVRADNGTKVWAFATGDVIHSTPAIEGDNVFFGSFDGHVYALHTTTGALVWKFKTIGQMYFPKGEVQGSPALYKGILLIGARDFNVYAISQQRGTGLWNRYLPNGWGLVNTVHDSVLHVGTGDERTFIAINPRTGRDYWSRPMELLVFGSNAYSANLLYVGTTMGKLHAIDIKTGTTRWTFTTQGYQKNRLKYFKADDSYRDDIYSLIKSNEQFVDVQGELGGIFSTPAITPQYIVLATTEGLIYCLGR